MRIVLKVLCVLLIAYCIYFPISYFHKDEDKKEIKISHILVDTQEEAIKIKHEIDKGKKKFEAAAEEYSKCPSKEDKGNLGYYIRESRLLPAFEDAAFKLPLKVVSEPVKTEAGWHLIKVYDIGYFSDRKNFDERYNMFYF